MPLERFEEARAFRVDLWLMDADRPVRGGVVGGVAAGVVPRGGGVAHAVGREQHVSRGEEALEVRHQVASR